MVLDTVHGASVDALGTATALFSVRFDHEGDHSLTARIVDANPGEYDASNNRVIELQVWVDKEIHKKRLLQQKRNIK